MTTRNRWALRWIGGLVAALLLVGSAHVARADTLSIATWSTGDSLNATNLNAKNTSIMTWAAGKIANDNISATAGIVGSKLDLTSGTGRIVQSGGTVTTSNPVLNSSQTWNAAGVTFTGWLLNITDTTSAIGSLLLDLQVGSVSQFSVTKAGAITASGNLVVSGVGPHAIGGAIGSNTQLTLTGTFESANTVGVAQIGTISSTSGTIVRGLYVGPILRANGAFTLTHANTLEIDAGALSLLGGAAATNAAALKINQAPSGATNNYALWAAAGGIRLGVLGAGAVQSDASGNLSVSSDERLKYVGGAFTRGFGALRSIVPITYIWRPESGMETAHEYVGFSAQQVQRTLPEAVGTDGRGYLSLNDRAITAAILNALREFDGRLSVLEERR